MTFSMSYTNVSYKAKNCNMPAIDISLQIQRYSEAITLTMTIPHAVNNASVHTYNLTCTNQTPYPEWSRHRNSERETERTGQRERERAVCVTKWMLLAWSVINRFHGSSCVTYVCVCVCVWIPGRTSCVCGVCVCVCVWILAWFCVCVWWQCVRLFVRVWSCVWIQNKCEVYSGMCVCVCVRARVCVSMIICAPFVCLDPWMSACIPFILSLFLYYTRVCVCACEFVCVFVCI